MWLRSAYFVLLLLCHNLVFDLVIDGLRNELLLDELILAGIRSAFDSLLGIRIADTRKPFQSVCRGAVEIQLFSGVEGCRIRDTQGKDRQRPQK